MRLKRRLYYWCETGLLLAAYALFHALPLDAASWLGGKLGAWLGPRLARHNRVARRNLALAFPEKSNAEREKILLGMWNHLGRNIAEMAHFRGNALVRRISCKGLENFPAPGQPVIFVSGHIGQWELAYCVVYEYGVPITFAYRHLNNPYTDRLMASLRASHCTNMFPKGPKGAAKMTGAIKRRESLALLIDQKMNEGLPIPFFGRDAMTAPAVVQLATRFNMPILPARVVRTKGCHFEGTAYPPVTIASTGDEQADIRATLIALNALLERWIRERPEQWMWIHRRWDKEFYKGADAI